jgi:hypothetical protein
MSDLSTTAERLRIVQLAFHEFLTRWVLDEALDRPGVAERIGRDIAAANPSEDADPFARSDRGLHFSDPFADQW